MKANEGKYRKVMEVLKKSEPVTGSQEEIEREVINRINHMPKRDKETFSIFSFLFGWTEIGWVRRSLVTASLFLVVIFVYQQSVIVKQLNWLSSQIVVNSERPVRTNISDFSGKLRFLRISGSRVPRADSQVSEKQLDMIMEALNKLQSDYNNLTKIIEENPELKEIKKKKLNEKDYIKVKL
ncbi:MAG: hypothetical protein HZB98_09810 [Bacteroidia bacterium]|nr:hypothetical protein [Bacteroidia bacterium]